MTYVPLITMVITVGGGVWAFAEIAPPVVYQPVPIRPFMPLHERQHLSSFGLPWVMTPDFGPEVFPEYTGGTYAPPTERLPIAAPSRARPGVMAGRFPAGRFPAPAAPVFARQAPTPEHTGETVAVAS